MMRRAPLLAMLIALSSATLSAQPGGANGPDAILDLVLSGSSETLNVAAFAEPLRTELEQYVHRATSYRSNRVVPKRGVAMMSAQKEVGYETLLVAATDDPRAPKLAAEYVNALHPCYEWEGFPDCPLRDARFADAYLAKHPDSPFADYLPILSAHSWLCAAELEKSNMSDAALARKRYQATLAKAKQSASLVVRTAAVRLGARGTCFGTR